MKVRRIATEATEEGERLADIAARASKEQAIADAHTLEVGHDGCSSDADT